MTAVKPFTLSKCTSWDRLASVLVKAAKPVLLSWVMETKLSCMMAGSWPVLLTVFYVHLKGHYTQL